jgi:hypothetical protein
MAYGIIKVDTITYTDGGSDQSISVSGLVQATSTSGDITSTGTIQAQNIIGLTTVSGATVSGDTGQFTNLTAVSGVFTAQISGATVTGNVGSFTTITGGTVTLTSGVFASGTAAAPSVSIGTTDNGLYSPGADQVAVATNGTGRLFVDASGNVGIGTSSPWSTFTVGSGGSANPAATATIHDSTHSEYRLKLTSTAFNSSGNWLGLGFGYSDNYLKAGIIAEAKDSNARANLHFCLDENVNNANANLDDSKMVITYDGKVGIGTTSPGSCLFMLVESATGYQWHQRSFDGV